MQVNYNSYTNSAGFLKRPSCGTLPKLFWTSPCTPPTHPCTPLPHPPSFSRLSSNLNMQIFHFIINFSFFWAHVCFIFSLSHLPSLPFSFLCLTLSHLFLTLSLSLSLSLNVPLFLSLFLPRSLSMSLSQFPLSIVLLNHLLTLSLSLSLSLSVFLFLFLSSDFRCWFSRHISPSS